MNDNQTKNKGITLRITRPDFEVFAIFYLSMTYVSHIFNLTIRHFVGNTHKLDTLFLYGLLMVVFVFAIQDVLSRIKKWQFLCAFVVVICVGISALIATESTTHMTVLKSIIFECLPMFLCGACIYNCRKVRNNLIKVMTVVPYCYLLMTVFLGLNTLTGDESYSQSDSYSMLFVSIILTDSLFERFRIRQLIPLGISLFFMLAYGARGPLACWILFVLMEMILQLNQKKLVSRLVIIVAVGIIGILIYVNFYTIMVFFESLFARLGFSVRVIDMLIDNSYLVDKSRTQIADICLARIWDSPLVGTGVVNDRIYITNHLRTGEDAIGNYPHNILLELPMQFGLLFGGMLLLLLAYLLVKSYCVALDMESKNFILVLIGTHLFPLFFSGSYLDSRGFYLLVAVCVTTVINQRKSIEICTVRSTTG